MSGAAGGGSSSLGAAAGASCSSAGPPYTAASGGGAGVAGRLPARVLELIFSYLELADLTRCALVCWHWNNILADENSEVWRSLAARTLSEEALRSDILCNLPFYKGKVGLLFGSHWETRGSSPRCLICTITARKCAWCIRRKHNYQNNVPAYCCIGEADNY